MESIIYRDPEMEASFSFSCYDFNSADLHVFSDDEGAGINDDEYIEIALEQPRLTYADGEDDGYRDRELELRISFSSTSFPRSFIEINSNNFENIGLSRTTTVESLGNESGTVATPSSSSSSSSSTSTLSCSSAESCWAAGTDPSRLTTDHDKSSLKRRVQFRSVTRLLGGFLYGTPRTSSEMAGTITTDRESSRQMAIQNNINKLELLRSRKAAKMSTKARSNGGMMMKFLIKCRCINIRAVLASFMKPYQVIVSSPQNNSSSGGGGGQIKKKRSTGTYQSLVKSMGTAGFGRKDKLKTNSPSCTSNKNSSPIQQGNRAGAGGGGGAAAGDNSIQAAIAHCKRSLGHRSEFSF